MKPDSSVFLKAKEMAKARDQAIFLRGYDPGKFNIMFYGAGSTVISSLQTLLGGLENIVFPIENIYLVDTGKMEKEPLRHLIMDDIGSSIIPSLNYGKRINIEYIKKDAIKEYLNELDIMFFAPQSNEGKVKDRADMIKSNLNLIKEFGQYINSDFKGLLNINANLPEVLAHYAAAELDVDVSKLLAHCPVDQFRGDFIYNQFKSFSIVEKFPVLFEEFEVGQQGLIEEQFNLNFSVMNIGYHDLLWPVIEGSNVYVMNESGQVMPLNLNLQNINVEEKQKLFEEVNFLAQKLFERQLKYEAKSGIRLQTGPTVYSTGHAIFRLLKAEINGEKTVAAIPYRGDKRNFFADLPVDFKTGKPVFDRERFYEAVKDTDIEFFKKIIEGGPYEYLKVHEQKRVPLNTLINKFLGEDCNFDIEKGIPQEKQSTIKEPIIQINLNKTLEPEKNEDSLEQKLKNSLQGSIYIKGDEGLIIEKYELNPDLKAKKIIFSSKLEEKHSKKFNRDNSLSRIISFKSDEKHLYVLTERPHEASYFGYRFFIFDKKNGHRIHVTKKEISEHYDGGYLKINDFEVEKGGVLISSYLRDGINERNNLLVYKPDETIRTSKHQLPLGIREILNIYSYKSLPVSQTSEQIFFGKEVVYNGENILYSGILSNGLMHLIDNDELVLLDLKNGTTKRMGNFGNYDINYNDGTTQLITFRKGNFEVFNFDNKSSINSYSEHYLIRAPSISKGSVPKIITNNLFFSFDGITKAIYHENGENYIIRDVEGITKANEMNLEVLIEK